MLVSTERANNRLLSYLPTRGGLAKRRGGAIDSRNMNIRIKQLVTVLYSVVVISVGVWRHLQTGSSPQAVWFGVVMGLIAIFGAVLLSLRNPLPGFLLIVLSLCFVAGWYLRRMFSGHPDGTSVRVIIILIACVIEGYVLVRRVQSSEHIEQSPAGDRLKAPPGE